MRLINKYFIHSPDEVNQSYVRSANTLLITLYLIVYAYLEKGIIFESYTIPAIGYLLLNIPLYFWAKRSISKGHAERVFYRILALTCDIIFLSIVMAYAGRGGTPLFFVYLWIILGNGIRYGIAYLIISSVISIISFLLVVYLTPVWQSQQLIPIVVGLLISLILLPLYILNLISKLSQALDSEKRANELKRAFLANMNHELRTPLSSIINLIELIKIEAWPSRIKSMLDMINVSATTQLNIINSILDISKLEADEFTLNTQDFNLYALVNEVNKIITPLTLNKEFDYSIVIDSKCESLCHGPYHQIKQILINLLSNAVKFTERGAVKFKLTAEKKGNHKQQIIFSIIDSGIGIDASQHAEIFKPFVQADSSISRKYGGTGLGLTISKELAQKMGGDIQIYSEKGSGTEVKFILDVSYSNAIKSRFTEVMLATINLDEMHTKIINYYKKIGVEVLTVDGLKDVDKLYKNLVIIFCSEKNSEVFTNNELIHLCNVAPKIQIVGEEESIDEKNVVTSLRSDSTEIELYNAMRICLALHYEKGSNENYKEDLSKINILLADDDPIVREMCKIYFSEVGHKIDIVENGDEALDYLNRRRYDVIVLDLHLPNISGADVARVCKDKNNHNCNVPLILLTADIYSANLDIYKSDFDIVLTKPVFPSKLLDVISKIIQKDNVKEEEVYKQLEGDAIVNEEWKNQILSIAGENITTVLEIYETEIIASVDDLLECLKFNNNQQALRIIHKLRGTALSIGAVAFSNEVDMLMEAIKNNNYKFNLDALRANMLIIHKLTMQRYTARIPKQKELLV